MNAPDVHPLRPEVLAAAEWFAAHRDECERPTVPALQRSFGLTAVEAVRAIQAAAVAAKSGDGSR